MTIGVRKYVDGALGSNNPVRQVWKEAQSLWCRYDGQLELLVKCIVSVGTGNPGVSAIENSAWGFLSKTLKDIATDTERIAEDFAAHNRGLLYKKRYFRYNVEQGLQAIVLEEYQKQADIETVTQTYLASQALKFNVMECARNLGTKQCVLADNFS